jgi:diketogulonate reductase-like aldo/keto reductase
LREAQVVLSWHLTEGTVVLTRGESA